MKTAAITLFLLCSLCLKATEQVSDLLIYKNDTIYLDSYPLEVLINSNSKIAKRLSDNIDCLKTSCWRQHIGIWKIEGDSLFLIGLKECCDYKPISLTKIFDRKQIQKQKVYANWYSAEIETGFGKRLGVSEKLEYIYEKKIKLRIRNGKVESIEIENTKNK